MRRFASLTLARAARVVGLALALLPGVVRAAAPGALTGDALPGVAEPPAVEANPPIDAIPPSEPPLAEAPPPIDAPPLDAPPPVEGPQPGDAPPVEPPADSQEGEPDGAPTAKKKKNKKAADEAPADGADAPKKPKKKKKKKPKEKHKVNQGTEYLVGVYPASYAQGPSFSAGVKAGIRQKIAPKKTTPIVFGLNYEYEPFSTKTLGFPEEDETMMEIRRTLVQPIHTLETRISRQIEWIKLVKTSLDLEADAWWPSIHSQQRLSARLTPRIRIGRATGPFGELSSELYYKKFPHYYIDSVKRRIDQEGVTPTAIVGYNVNKIARLAAGFTIDFTHYLDARYNALNASGSFVAADGSFIRAHDSKNYIDYIPFADIVVRPVKGLRIRTRYAFERQKTQHYDRVMTGRDEFASLVPKFFHGYYDYRRHRGNLWLSWQFRDRLELTASAAAWVRHFDVYEARTVDNFWTGQLRLDTELEGSLGLAVRAFSIKRPKMQHDFYVSLLGSHASRRSNQKREISLATNFDITRVILGFEVRGH